MLQSTPTRLGPTMCTMVGAVLAGYYASVAYLHLYVLCKFTRGVFMLTLPQVGAVFSRQVPPTRTEKEMRRRLAEMKETEESP